MNLLIGSRALAYHDDTFNPRENSDWDVISDIHLEGTEWHHPDDLSNDLLSAYTSGQTTLPNGIVVDVVNPIGLTIIKRSHLWRDMYFDKHIAQYHKHLSKFTEQFTSDEWKLLKHRTKLTHAMFEQGGPKLNMTKEEFFDDAVVKKYDHDYLHELVAYNSSPMYTRMLKHSDTVWCEQSKWETFTYLEKCQTVAEETYVIAIERFMVPNDWEFISKQAYYQALKKVCTTLCSGWFRDHALDHFPTIMNMFDPIKFKTVQSVLKD